MFEQSIQWLTRLTLTFYRFIKYYLLFLIVILASGLLLPENNTIPVSGAKVADWHPDSFWYEPWGESKVHKGIDIFAKKGTSVLASTGGWVIYRDTLSKGGKVLVVLGPKWRIHYYAHLDDYEVEAGDFVSAGESIGKVGNTGNARNTPAHLHYSITSLLPMPWRITWHTQGWKKMFYLDPDEKLRQDF